MTTTALVSLNAGGTKGHEVPITSIKNSLIERGNKVIYCSKEPLADLQLQSSDQQYSVGGMIRDPHTDQFLEMLTSSDVDTVLFSTFFDPDFVEKARSRGIKTGLISYPLRNAHSELLVQRSYLERFDTVFQYEDLYDSMIPGARKVSPIIKPSDRDNVIPNSILVTGGGGGRPSADSFYPLVEKSIEQILDVNPSFQITVVDPLSKSRSAKRGVKRIKWFQDFSKPLSTHSMVVSEAGYHTVAEMISLGIPGVLIPGSRRIDDQELRASRFEQKGYGFCVLPEESPTTLTQRILETLEREGHQKKHDWKFPQVDEAIERWIQ